MSSQPGTTGRAGTPGETGDPHPGQTPEAGPRRAADQPWPLVLPLALLIILGLAGLRGALTAPRWNESARHDGVAIGLVLEVILVALLVLMARRRSRAARAAMLSGVPVSDVAAKLRGVLIVVLGAGIIAVAVAIFVSLHLHLPTPAPRQASPSVKARPTSSLALRPGSQGTGFSIPVSAFLYALLIVVLVAAVLLSIWWARRFRPSPGGRHGDFLAEDPEDLREAVESGRSALRTLDDARAAIIACYVAMENSLAERGAARAVADTPDELLARATTSGLVRGNAAARLTALFYEARFSSHPLGRGQRDAAEQALDELAAALAEAAASRTEPEQTQAGAGP
jgi:Domain of unknown function (DUF4129)